MDSRKQPLHTCAVSLLEVADRACKTASLPSSSSIICAFQCRLLAILAFVDGWILSLESLAEAICPPLKRLFDRIDELVRTAEGLPLKFDDGIEKIPALVQQVPFLEWALVCSISWLEWLLSVLTDLGMRVKEKEINVVDVNYSKRAEFPDDQTGNPFPDDQTGKPETVQEIDQEFASNNDGKDSGTDDEHALTRNCELKIAAGDHRTSRDLEHQEFMADSENRTLTANEPALEPETDLEAFLTRNESTIAQEKGQHELTREEPGSMADEKCETGEQTLEHEATVPLENGADDELTTKEPSVTSSAIVSETDETATESDCSSRVKSEREILEHFFAKKPETGMIPGGAGGNLVAGSNVVKGSYKDVLVKPGKRHVKKVINRGNTVDGGGKEEVISREGKGRSRKGRRKKGSLQVSGFMGPTM